jgi:hypothetical protein
MALLFILMIATVQMSWSQTKAPLSAAVPFVGCKSNGQVGPQPAPDRPDKVPEVDAKVSQRLAYYKAESGSGVLGPLGWNCFGFYGSDGTTLLVTPGPVTDRMTAGPAIQLTERAGDTSGRFEVARVAARIFPAQRDFVQRVIDEGIAPASDFPQGPYPTDRLVYRGDRVVEYETPPRAQGLGTISRLEPNNDAIRGVAILQNDTPDLLLLAMRLPSNMSDLAAIIIQQIEKE